MPRSPVTPKRKRPPNSSGNASSSRTPGTAGRGYGASSNSSSATVSSLPRWPKHEPSEVLILDSDHSEDEVEHQLACSSPKVCTSCLFSRGRKLHNGDKKPRLGDNDDCLEYNSDDDYEGFLLGMNDHTIVR